MFICHYQYKNDDNNTCCKGIEDMTDRPFSPHQSYCINECKGDKKFVQEDMGIRHLLGLSKLPEMPIEDFTIRSQNILGNEYAQQVLINAARSGYYSKKYLTSIAKKLDL